MQPSDLTEHDCLHLGSAARATVWRLVDGRHSVEVMVNGRIALNSNGLMRTLAERGMVIAMLSPMLVRESLSSGRLLPVLPTYSAAGLPLQAVTSSRLQSAAARAFITFMASRLAKTSCTPRAALPSTSTPRWRSTTRMVPTACKAWPR